MDNPNWRHTTDAVSDSFDGLLQHHDIDATAQPTEESAIHGVGTSLDLDINGNHGLVFLTHLQVQAVTIRAIHPQQSVAYICDNVGRSKPSIHSTHQRQPHVDSYHSRQLIGWRPVNAVAGIAVAQAPVVQSTPVIQSLRQAVPRLQLPNENMNEVKIEELDSDQMSAKGSNINSIKFVKLRQDIMFEYPGTPDLRKVLKDRVGVNNPRKRS